MGSSEARGFSDGDFIRWGFDIADTEPLSSPSLPVHGQKCRNRHREPASSKTSELKDWTPKRSARKISRHHVQNTKGRGDNSYKPVKKAKVARAMTGIAGVDSTYPLDHLLSISTYLLGDTLQFDSDDETWPGEPNNQSPNKGYKAIVQERLPEMLQSEDTPGRPRKLNNSMPILCNELDISQFIRLKGAVEAPHLAMRRELLQTFCFHVHPTLPALNLSDALNKVLNAPDGSATTLLLAQSIMLAAAAFIHSPDKCYPGCLSHRELRRTFFQKAKMIYESNLEAEADTITQIQSLLLMSSWQDEGDYAKDSHYWLSLAISTAQRLGLHQKTSAPRSPLHRRLWWCIYLQDIRISLALRRPRQIKDEDITVEPLTEEDLYCCFVSDRIFPALASLQSMLDSRNQHAIIRQFLLTVQLGLQAGKVLDDFYHVSWTQTIDPQLPLLLQPNTSITLTMGVSTEGSLDSAARVPGANSFELREELTAINSEDDLRRVSLVVQRMDYYLLHRSALCYLFRSLDFSPQTSCSVWNVRLSDAARDITSIVELFCHRLDAILVPGIAVTALSLAKEVHAMELKSARGNNKMHPLSMFRLCERTLKGLYETYPAAISQSGLP